jgi:hypothetical protein
MVHYQPGWDRMASLARGAAVKSWLVRCTVATLAVGILAAPANRALAGPTAPTAAKMRIMAATIGRAQITAGWYCGYAIKPNG